MFLKVLKEIHGWKLEKLHLLASSWKVRDIEETLSGLVSHQAPMDEDFVDGYIRVHVSRTLDHDIKFRMCSAEKEMVKTTLMEGAHGM